MVQPVLVRPLMLQIEKANGGRGGTVQPFVAKTSQAQTSHLVRRERNGAKSLRHGAVRLLWIGIEHIALHLDRQVNTSGSDNVCRV